MKISKFVYISMPVAIIMAFLWAPSADILGNSSRIIYFHVPLAWGGVLAFIISGIFSIVVLTDKNRKYHFLDEKAFNSAQIGMIFTVLATVSGSIWSKLSWGSYWNWDPRQTSITVLLLIYIAYFSLWAALRESPGRGRICSAYLVFAMVTVPFFIFIIPRMYPTLHPDPIINPERKLRMDFEMRMTLLVSTFSFTLLYLYLLNLLNRVTVIENNFRERHDEQ